MIDVSVIVTSRNEEKNIAACLDSVKAQIFPRDKLELIVVDNNSSDSTKEVASAFTNRIFNYGPERSAQRNFGIKQAQGGYILYLDADMILSKNVLTECMDKCSNNGCIGIFIPERIIGEGFWIKVRDFERSFYDATVIDCARFIQKNAFLEIGGFDEGLTGPEDWDFDRRLRTRGRVDIIESAIYHNENGFSFKKYLGKKIYYVNYFNKYINKWGRNDAVVRKQLGFFYRMLVVFMEEGKWRRLFRHPILTLGLFFLRSCLGLRYLSRKIMPCVNLQ